MFSEELKELIDITLQDGVLTDQERAVIVKRAQKEGIDVDELEIYIQSLLQKRNQAVTNETSGSWELLQAKLEDVEPKSGFAKAFDTHSGRRKDEIIVHFPVPGTRADLLEFLSALQPLAKNKKRSIIEPDEMMKMASPGAYWQLFCNCINKARISFANDPSFKFFFDFYEEESKPKKGFFSKLFGK
ncbi:MAG: hypothetical protein IKG99_00225 [Bacteroidaceae bacterium]|nr:hypothetical protein [Bacteroidaceae bacterium]MBR3454611.1 hypothetical protein [Bacteroidaceae bacterium]